MKKILLVVSPYFYSHPNVPRSELLGIGYLAAAIEQAGYEVEVFDPTLEMQPPTEEEPRYYFGVSDAQMRERIAASKADVVGISCHYSFAADQALAVGKLAKELLPGCITLLGGLYASVFKDDASKVGSDIDFIMIGESENTIVKFLDSQFEAEVDVETIDGLVYSKNGAWIVNEKTSFIEDLDSLPFPARDKLEIERYMNGKTVLYGLGTRPTLSLLSSRSCPYKCTFCNMWTVHGPKWRLRSPENVLAELEEMVLKYKAEHIFVMDDNFTFNPDRVKKICEGILSKGLKFKWNTPNGIYVKHVDLEMAKLMKRAGCVNVCLGIESGSEYIRKKVMKKNMGNEEIERAISIFNEARLQVGGFFVIGMPGENQEEWQKTIDFVKNSKLDFLVSSFAVPMPGTKLYEQLVEIDAISASRRNALDNFSAPQYETEDFDKVELLRRRRELFKVFYIPRAPKIAFDFLTGRLSWFTMDMAARTLRDRVLNPA